MVKFIILFYFILCRQHKPQTYLFLFWKKSVWGCAICMAINFGSNLKHTTLCCFVGVVFWFTLASTSHGHPKTNDQKHTRSFVICSFLGIYTMYACSSIVVGPEKKYKIFLSWVVLQASKYCTLIVLPVRMTWLTQAELGASWGWCIQVLCIARN